MQSSKTIQLGPISSAITEEKVNQVFSVHGVKKAQIFGQYAYLTFNQNASDVIETLAFSYEDYKVPQLENAVISQVASGFDLEQVRKSRMNQKQESAQFIINQEGQAKKQQVQEQTVTYEENKPVEIDIKHEQNQRQIQEKRQQQQLRKKQQEQQARLKQQKKIQEAERKQKQDQQKRKFQKQKRQKELAKIAQQQKQREQQMKENRKQLQNLGNKAQDIGEGLHEAAKNIADQWNIKPNEFFGKKRQSNISRLFIFGVLCAWSIFVLSV